MAKRKRSKKAGVKVVRIKGMGLRCRRTTGPKKGKLTRNSACGLKKKR